MTFITSSSFKNTSTHRQNAKLLVLNLLSSRNKYLVEKTLPVNLYVIISKLETSRATYWQKQQSRDSWL